MRLSLLFFFLSTTIFSIILLNDYDRVGYILSSEFLSFKFDGKCPVGESTPVSFYNPPSKEVDVYGDFPRNPFAFMSNGVTIGTTNTSVEVPEWVFKELRKSEIYCYDHPIDFLSPSVIKVLENMKSWEIGSVVSKIMENVGEYWELPTKPEFKSGEVISLIPRDPVVDLKYAESPGVGVVAFPEIRDFSSYNYSWVVDGAALESSILILPPGNHKITLVATDSIGFNRSKTLKVNVTPFQIVKKKMRCEIGIDNCEVLTGSRSPGVYVIKSVKTYGMFTFIIDATETTFPEIHLSIRDRFVSVSATDPSGAKVFVFVNGRIGDRLINGENVVEAVAMDPYGNITLMATEVIKSPDVREILNLRSPFYVGWGK